MPGMSPDTSDAEDVVHHIAAERAAGVEIALAAARGPRVHQDLGRGHRRGAQEHHSRRDHLGLACVGIDHAYAGHPLARRIIFEVGDHRIGAQRQPARGARCGQRHRLGREVGAERAAAAALVAVLALASGPARACPRSCCDSRALISLRPGNFVSSRSFSHFSAMFICIGGWNSLSGSCGRFSREPDTPIYFST